MKFLTIPFASLLFATVSFAQIPMTTVVLVDPTIPVTPNTPGTSNSSNNVSAPQPLLVPCTGTADPLNNTKWAFSDSSVSTEVGMFSIMRPLGGRGGLAVTGTLTGRINGMVYRLAPFTGSIDYTCIASNPTIPAAGTFYINDGIGGQIFTYAFPITATIGLDRSVTYAVTSITTLNFRRFGAIGNSSTDGYSYQVLDRLL